MEEEKNHQHCIEEVVPKKGWVVVNRVDPGTVDQPEEQEKENLHKSFPP